MAHSKLRDVAARCGVSVSTASRALNNRSDVSPKTRAKVLAAAEALGYVPSSLAKGLWLGKTKTVGVVVTTIANPFYANVVIGIEKVLAERGYNILLNSSLEDPKTELRAVKLLLERRVDGILLAPVQSEPEAVAFLEKNRVPYVLVGRNVRNVETNYVVCDDHRIGELAGEYLVKKGHRQILFLNSSQNDSARLRQEGFCAALRAAGIELEDKWIRPVNGNQDVKEVLVQALEGGLDPTAIFCFCDYMAIEVIGELRRRGRRIPEDVAVIGVDNLGVSELLNPPLTTIDIQNSRMGLLGAQILLKAMANPVRPAEKLVLTPHLVERASA